MQSTTCDDIVIIFFNLPNEDEVVHEMACTSTPFSLLCHSVNIHFLITVLHIFLMLLLCISGENFFEHQGNLQCISGLSSKIG